MVVPTIISQLITVVYNLADTWYVGLTEEAAIVAAISLCLPVYCIMTAIAYAINQGITQGMLLNPAQKQTGWKNGDISLADGWLALLYGGEEQSGSYPGMMIIGHIDEQCEIPENPCAFQTRENQDND